MQLFGASVPVLIRLFLFVHRSQLDGDKITFKDFTKVLGPEAAENLTVDIYQGFNTL